MPKCLFSLETLVKELKRTIQQLQTTWFVVFSIILDLKYSVCSSIPFALIFCISIYHFTLPLSINIYLYPFIFLPFLVTTQYIIIITFDTHSALWYVLTFISFIKIISHQRHISKGLISNGQFSHIYPGDLKRTTLYNAVIVLYGITPIYRSTAYYDTISPEHLDRYQIRNTNFNSIYQ